MSTIPTRIPPLPPINDPADHTHPVEKSATNEVARDLYLASPPDIILAASRDNTLINVLRERAPQKIKAYVEFIYYMATIRNKKTPGEEIVGLELIDATSGGKIGIVVCK